MKHLLVTSLTAIGMIMNVSAQNTTNAKLLAMEDAVLGHYCYPENRYFAWQGEQNKLTYSDGPLLMVQDLKGKVDTLLTIEDLNTILDTNLKGFPNYSWKDAKTLVLNRAGAYTEIDIKDKKIIRTFSLPKKAENITFNDNKNAFAYTKGNNLFFCDSLGKEIQITHDTNLNIVNGQSVSRNEFGITGGIFWSPNGAKIAFYRKDESDVTSFPLLDITTRTGSLKEIKYPMAGMASEHIKLGVYDLLSGHIQYMNVTDFDDERYLTNITWSPNSEKIYIQVLNRAQKEMHLNRYDAKSGTLEKNLFVEKSDKYVEPLNPLVFLSTDETKFIYRTNCRDGYFSLYLYDTEGKMLRRLTSVNADVVLVGEDGKNLYYTSAEVSPVENHLFKVPMKGGKIARLTTVEGWHDVKMSKDMKYFIDSYSNVSTPRIISLSGNKVNRTLFTAEDPLKDYAYCKTTLGSVKSADGKYNNYYRLLTPPDFDETKKYPVILYVYGGPHSQMVQNTWRGNIRMWEYYMAQQGYVVFVMDNRGTENQGEAYEKAIHRYCGQVEMADQMEGMKWLMSHSWVDQNRIGVHGWSYGGFMTISLTTNYPEIFKVAVAGGPVIDWKWYEVMYGERYMETPQCNPEGFEKVSLIGKAKDLKSKLLICQGAIDGTVVWEHSLSFIRECIKNNVQVDYFPYPCAEHNVRGRDRVHLMQKVTNYFDDYLK